MTPRLALFVLSAVALLLSACGCSMNSNAPVCRASVTGQLAAASLTYPITHQLDDGSRYRAEGESLAQAAQSGSLAALAAFVL